MCLMFAMMMLQPRYHLLASVSSVTVTRNTQTLFGKFWPLHCETFFRSLTKLYKLLRNQPTNDFGRLLPIILAPISIDKRQNFPFKLEFSWWAVCALWSPLTSPLSPLSEHSVHSSSAEMRRRWLRIWSSSQVWVISSADQTSDGQELQRWSACQTTLYNT